MTETQNPHHRRPLAPGEIRMARVGRVIFKVMHIAGGSFTQAIALRPDAPTEVIATEIFEQDAVRAYADAIEQAERAVAPSLPAVPQDRTADGVPEVEQARPLDLSLAIAETKRFEEIDRAAVARGESANWWERGTESSAPAPTLADDVAALRAAIHDGWHVEGGAELQHALAILDRIAGAVSQRAAEGDVIRYARRWYYEHGYVPGYLPRNVLGSDRDLKAAVEALGEVR